MIKQIVKYIWIIKGLAYISMIGFTANLAFAEPITVVSWGGSYGKAQDAALFNYASKNTGIEIN